MRTRNDRGSATIWSLGVIAVLLAVFSAGLLMGQAVVARHRAGGAADLAALAAADHALDGRRKACAVAARVAAAQGAALRECVIAGELAEVVTAVGRATARSRAGPADSPGSSAGFRAPGPGAAHPDAAARHPRAGAARPARVVGSSPRADPRRDWAGEPRRAARTAT